MTKGQIYYLLTLACLILVCLMLNLTHTPYYGEQEFKGMMTVEEKAKFFKNSRFTMVNRLMADKGGE